MVFVLFWLISLSIMLSRSIHIIPNGKISPSWLRNTLVYLCTTPSVSIPPSADTQGSAVLSGRIRELARVEG